MLVVIKSVMVFLIVKKVSQVSVSHRVLLSDHYQKVYPFLAFF